MRFVTGGCDNTCKIWGFDQQGGWTQAGHFDSANGHKDWVRDVAWAPSAGLLPNTVASCSEDKSVILWTEDKGNWKVHKKLNFDAKVKTSKCQ